MVRILEGRIPVPVRSERVGVIIGKNGATKKMLEEIFNVKIEIDAENAIIYIIPSKTLSPFKVLKARQAIEALSLGFSAEDIQLLEDDMVYLETIDLSEYARNRNDLVRIKSRLIGSEGRFKRTLEEITGTRIVIGDKIIGIIGDYEQIRVAREAILMIIRGKAHRTVMTYLQSESRLLKRRRMQLWEKWETFK